MTTTPNELLSAVLAGTAKALDIPAELYAAADAQYHAIGEFLAGRDDAIGGAWEIYPQGSFRLGTVVRPTVRGDEYDIDMVCKAEVAKTGITKAELKEAVGDALDDYVNDNRETQGAPEKRSESGRCWTLEYEAPFHMDVLPAIPDVKNLPTGILLTDRDLREWLHSNPIAYADWFRSRMAEELKAKRIAKAAELRADVEDIPDWEVKTTLQLVVQVLKRHRDIYFAQDLDDRPPSILVTTVAALTYTGAAELLDAVLEAATNIRSHVQQENGLWIVENPVAQQENFADKWQSHPERARKFFAWLEQLQRDLEEAQRSAGLDRVVTRLSKSFGATPVREAARELGDGYRERSASGDIKMSVNGLLGAAAGAAVKPHTFYGQHEAED